jgi:hypothetical protein
MHSMRVNPATHLARSQAMPVESRILRQLISALVGAGLVTGCALRTASAPLEQLDHVVLAISDLGAGIEQLGSICGVAPVRGGVHPRTGTENALLSSGSGAYLEILAPQPGAGLSPEYGVLRAVGDLLPASWAVATRNADVTVENLRAAGYFVSEPQAGSRQTPLGDVIRWRTFEVTRPQIAGAPFFIEWDPASAHPATTSPAGCSLLSLEHHTPDDEQLRRLMTLLHLEGQVVRGATARLVVTLKGASGPARLPRTF